MTELEDAAYKAGAIDARLIGLEAHALAVNGSIERTAKALVDLTVVVEKVSVTLDLLKLTDLRDRLATLEAWQETQTGITYFKRWLYGAAISLVLAVAAIVALLLT